MEGKSPFYPLSVPHRVLEMGVRGPGSQEFEQAIGCGEFATILAKAERSQQAEPLVH